jgi:Ca-activated chloride channel family protein
MKTLPVLLLAASLLLRQATAAPTHDLTLRVAPERDLVYKQGPREVVVLIDLEGRRGEQARRVPMNLAIVLDRSGSMQGAKIEKARQAACVAVDQLADDDYFSLVIFDHDTELLIPPARVGDRRHRDALKERIDRIRPGGSTAIHAGLTLGAEQLRRFFDKEHVNRIVLLSDGLANVGPRNASDFASLGRELRQQSMSVTTIGLGDDYNEDLMTALAEASNANYYYVRDAEKLPGIFAEELGAARSLIARGVSIRITVPEGVRIREIIGRPEIDCTGRSVEIQLPEYFAGDKRRFLARCTADEAKGEALELAMVDLRYASGTGEKSPGQQQAANIRFTDEADKAEKSLRTDVAREVEIVNNRLAKEQAVKLADEGKVKESAEVLRNQAAANAAAPAAVKLPEWDKENKKLEDAAREVESKGQLGKSSRKQIQYENWQDKYQKR